MSDTLHTPERPKGNAGVIAPPPLIFGVPLLTSLLANRWLRVGFFPERARKKVGLPLIVGGLALGLWFFATMKKAGTPVDPREPVESLVTGGPFAHTRNPAYVAMTAVFAGASILGNSLPSVLALPLVLTVMERAVIEREESYLQERFGEEYLRYKSRVRRWL